MAERRSVTVATYRDSPVVDEIVEVLAASYQMTKTELIRNYVYSGLLRDLTEPSQREVRLRLIQGFKERRKK